MLVSRGAWFGPRPIRPLTITLPTLIALGQLLQHWPLVAQAPRLFQAPAEAARPVPAAARSIAAVERARKAVFAWLGAPARPSERQRLCRPATCAHAPVDTPGSTPGRRTGRPTRLQGAADMAAQSPAFGGPPRGPQEDASLVDFIKASSAAGGARQQLQAPAAATPPPLLPPAAAGTRGLAALVWGHCMAGYDRLEHVAAADGSPLLVALPPQVHGQPEQLPLPPPLPQISSKEEPRHYSAKIAWNARNNSHMPLLATGAPAINCAIKVRLPRAGGCCPGCQATLWLLAVTTGQPVRCSLDFYAGRKCSKI